MGQKEGRWLQKGQCLEPRGQVIEDGWEPQISSGDWPEQEYRTWCSKVDCASKCRAVWEERQEYIESGNYYLTSTNGGWSLHKGNLALPSMWVSSFWGRTRDYRRGELTLNSQEISWLLGLVTCPANARNTLTGMSVPIVIPSTDLSTLAGEWLSSPLAH